MVGISAFAFALRFVPTWKKRWFGNDSYYHLLVSRSWRTQHKYPRTDPNLLPTNANTYPPLLQVFVRPVASINDRWAMMFISPLFDTITVILLFVAGDWIHISQPLLPPLIYAVSANNLLDASTLNPRSLGNMLLAGAALALLGFSESGSLVVYAVLILMEALVLLSHKLSVQVLVPLVVIVSFVMVFDPTNAERSIPMLLSLPLAVLVATALTGGAYIRKILPDHIHYIAVHFRHGEYRTGKRKIPSPLSLFKSNPIAFIAPFLGFYLYFTQDEYSSASDLLYGLWLPWSTLTLVLGQFWVWGDSWRYLQIGTFPGSIVTVEFITTYAPTQNEAVLVLAIVIICLAIIAYFQVKNAMGRDIGAKIATILESLPREWKTKLAGAKIYSNVQHYIVPYLTESSSLQGSPSSAGMEQSFRAAGLVKTSFREIEGYARSTKTSLDYFLIFKEFPMPTPDGYRRVYDSERVAIYEIVTAQPA